MAMNKPLGKGRTTIASGSGKLQLPQYVTVSTGKHSEMEDRVEIVVREGNTIHDPVYSEWVPLHGAQVKYHKHGKWVTTTVTDDHTVQFMATGAWTVRVELPPE